MPEEQHLPDHNRKQVRLFLCGDVTCGRGIDQVLAHPCSPEIYEDYMRSAESYVLLAERANGAHSAAQRGVLRLGRCAGRVGANAAGRADHQSRNGRDPQQQPREQGHQLPYEPRKCRVSGGRRDRLLCVGQQPYARLGMLRPDGHAGNLAKTQHRSDGRGPQ